jgi:hypothetical protein
MNRKRSKKIGTKQQEWSLNLQVVHPNAAGIDIGNQSHYVAVPPDRDPTPVRQFGRLGHRAALCGVRSHPLCPRFEYKRALNSAI